MSYYKQKWNVYICKEFEEKKRHLFSLHLLCDKLRFHQLPRHNQTNIHTQYMQRDIFSFTSIDALSLCSDQTPDSFSNFFCTTNTNGMKIKIISCFPMHCTNLIVWWTTNEMKDALKPYIHINTDGL